MPNFTREDLVQVEVAKDIESARIQALNILEKCHPKNSKTPMAPGKFAYMRNQIESCPDSKRLLSMMWNLLLSGEKMAVVDSKYQRNH